MLVKLLGARKYPVGGTMLREHGDQAYPLLIRELDGKTAGEQTSLIHTLHIVRAPKWDLGALKFHAATVARRDAEPVAALDAPSLSVRRGIAKVLAQVGPTSATVATPVPALLRLAQDKDPEARLDAIDALLAVDAQHQSWEKWLPTLEAFLREKNNEARTRALVRIRWLGPRAKATAPTLVASLADAGPNRALTAVTLVRVERKPSRCSRRWSETTPTHGWRTPSPR